MAEPDNAAPPEIAPGNAPECEESEAPWWQLLIIYTRDWIHYGALAFFLVVVLMAAVRGILAR